MVMSASELLQIASVNQLGTTLATSGGSVTVAAATTQEVPKLQSLVTSPEIAALVAQWAKRSEQTPVLAMHPTAQEALASSSRQWTPQQKVAVGIGTGSMVGAGVALVAEALRAVDPYSGAALTLGCVLIGGGLGGAMGGGILGELSFDAKAQTFTLKAAT